MKRSPEGKDGPGNPYMNFGDWTRLTFVERKRGDQKDWAGSDVIRIDSYREEGTDALHRGPEIPIGQPDDALEFVATFIRLYRANRPFTD